MPDITALRLCSASLATQNRVQKNSQVAKDFQGSNVVASAIVICETPLTIGEIVIDANAIGEITQEVKEQQGWFRSEQF